jgi:hypothetical protein
MSKRKPRDWQPPIGKLAFYNAENSSLSPGHGFLVRVVAETGGQRMCVEAIGRHGVPVQITVKTKNLSPPAPGLFDE